MAQQLSEIEVLVEELESRVERLRALYEMYFMGIEKIEPAVPRKDVDRRFYVLRRTQIRNTALRFRFLNVLLRYNTYQTYWMRISRKIEEGTYKRDVRRANARFADGPSSVKGKGIGKGKDAPDEEIELGDVDLTELDEVRHDTEPPSSRTGVLDDVSAALSSRGRELEDELSLNLDLPGDDFNPDSGWLDDQRARAVLRPAPVPKEAREEPIAPRPKGPLDVMATQREIWIKPPAQRPSSRPTSRPPSNSRPAKGRPSSAPGAKIAAPKKSPAEAPAASPPGPQARGGLRYAQGPQARRASEIPIPGRVPAAQPASGRSPQGGPPPRKRSRPSMPKVEPSKPASTRPAARAQPAAPAAKPATQGLSDERVRQIYTKYVETKRSLKESTASLTFDSLAKSLRDSSDKLKSKHTGKSVDFEVAVKDGRTILRPVVK